MLPKVCSFNLSNKLTIRFFQQTWGSQRHWVSECTGVFSVGVAFLLFCRWIFLQCSLLQSHIVSCTFPKQLSEVATANFIFLRQDKSATGNFFYSLFLLGDWEKKQDTTSLGIWHQIIAEFSEVPHDFIVNPYNICMDGTEYEINTWEEMLNHAKISVGGEYPENPLGRIFGYF